MMVPHTRTKGFVLIIVLALLGLLAFLGVTIVQSSKAERSLSISSLLQTKALLLARSGIEHAVSSFSQSSLVDRIEKTAPLGEGTIAENKDIYHVSSIDGNSQLNVNDGIKAGQLELGSLYDATRFDPFNEFYLLPENIASLRKDTFFGLKSLSVNTPPTDGVLPGDQITFNLTGSNHVARILFNGATNQLEDKILVRFDKQMPPGFIPTATNIRFHRPTESASGICNLRIRRLLNSFGDLHRFLDQIGDPDPLGNNYGQGLNYITDSSTVDKTVNQPTLYETDGLGDLIISKRPGNGYQDFETLSLLINNWGTTHLSEVYLEDTTFFELIHDELTLSSFEDDQIFRLKKEHGIYGTEKSAPCFSADEQEIIGLFDLDRFPPDLANPWAPHSAALINSNGASELIKAAIFSSIVNPSYLCETSRTLPGMKTVIPYALEFRLAKPAIGVGGHVFKRDKILENGVLDPTQKNRFMSYRDALILSKSYTDYLSSTAILNFDDFKKFLIWHRQNSLHTPVFERAEPFGTYNADPLFGGHFTEDYVEESLPHFLNCVRRMPGYLGAPAPLLSPYVQTNAFHSNANAGWVTTGSTPPFSPLTAFAVSRKIEDFVRRVPLPKIIFQPGGKYSTISIGTIRTEDSSIVTRVTINTFIDLFETRYARTQQKFVELTDAAQTDTDMLIGPNFIGPAGPQIPHQELGFVGLKSIDDPINYSPQIAMNFNGNLLPEPGRNEPSITDDDLFLTLSSPYPTLAINSDNTETMWDSELEQPTASRYFFSTNVVTDDNCDVHPFGGVFLSNIQHGFQTDDLHNNFRDVLYWRLEGPLAIPQEFIDPGISPSLAGAFNKGLSEIWFRIPSVYDIPHRLGTGSSIVESKFSFAIWSLNLWQASSAPSPILNHPTNIALTYRRSAETGIGQISARVQLGETIAPGSGDYNYHAENNGYPLLGFANDPLLALQKDLISIQDPLDSSYASWIEADERYYEVTAFLKDIPENAPGTWHRVTVGWDFSREQDGSDWIFPYNDKFWLHVHDESNVDNYTHVYDTDVNQFFETQSGNHELTVGEVFYQRPVNYYTNFLNFFGAEIYDHFEYTPHWRLNSCIDNFRFYSNDDSLPANYEYGGSEYSISKPRYDVSNQPTWVINPELPLKSKIIGLGARIYNPKDSKDSDPNGPNYPHVSISFKNSSLNTIATIASSENTHDHIYNYYEIAGGERFHLTYNNSNINGNNLINDGTDNWNEIPWIKEISYRYQTPNQPKFIHWQQK